MLLSVGPLVDLGLQQEGVAGDELRQRVPLPRHDKVLFRQLKRRAVVPPAVPEIDEPLLPICCDGRSYSFEDQTLRGRDKPYV